MESVRGICISKLLERAFGELDGGADMAYYGSTTAEQEISKSWTSMPLGMIFSVSVVVTCHGGACGKVK